MANYVFGGLRLASSLDLPSLATLSVAATDGDADIDIERLDRRRAMRLPITCSTTAPPSLATDTRKPGRRGERMTGLTGRDGPILPRICIEYQMPRPKRSPSAITCR